MKRRDLLTAAAGAAVGAGPGMARQARAQGLEKVTVSWLPIMQTMAFYIAQEDKLFERAGLAIEAVRFEAPNQIIDSLVAGRADMGAPGAAAGIAALAEVQFPGTFKVFGLQGGSVKADRINDALIVRKGSSIKGFADLRGKTLGHLPGIQWRTISRYVVRKAGLDPDHDIRLVELAVGLQVPAVIAGTVDATLSLEPVGSIAVASGEAQRAVTNPVAQVIADPFYSGVSLLTTKFLKERPATAHKVVIVLDEATQRANADFTRYRAILPRFTAVKATQIDIVAQPYLRGFSELDATDLASYQALVDVFASEGVLKQHFDVKPFILKPVDFGG